MHSEAADASYRPQLAVELEVGPAPRSKFWCNILSDSPFRRLGRGGIPVDQDMEKRSAARRHTTSDSGNESSDPTSGGASGSGTVAAPRRSRSDIAQSSSAARTSSSRVSNASGSSKASKSSRPFTTQASYASPENWDMHRAEITALYLDQDKTLREVKDHMEKTHGFFATWVCLHL